MLFGDAKQNVSAILSKLSESSNAKSATTTEKVLVKS